MKLLSLILLLSCISLFTYSQNQPFFDPVSQLYPNDFGLNPDMVFPETNFPNRLVYRTGQLQPIRETYWQWDESSDSLNKTVRYLHTYGPTGSLIRSVYQQFENGIWKDESAIIYVYNIDHQLITQQFESWVNHSWVPTYRNIHFYNDDKSLSEKVLQAWEEEKWINVSRKQIENDSSLLTTTETNQYWVTNQWINSNRVIRQYNICEMLKTRLFQTWVNGNWINDIRESYSYGQHRLPGKVAMFKWVQEDWKETGAYHYTYDLNKNPTSISYYNVNPLEWNKDFKWSYDYNESNQLIRESFSTGTIDAWENFIQNNYQYNPAGNKISLMSQVWEGQWRDREYIEYAYEEKDAALPVTINELAIFPNPVNNELNVVLPENIVCPCTISVSGMDGKIALLSSPVQGGHYYFSAATLIPGLYNATLMAQNLQLSGAFVKQ